MHLITDQMMPYTSHARYSISYSLRGTSSFFYPLTRDVWLLAATWQKIVNVPLVLVTSSVSCPITRRCSTNELTKSFRLSSNIHKTNFRWHTSRDHSQLTPPDCRRGKGILLTDRQAQNHTKPIYKRHVTTSVAAALALVFMGVARGGITLLNF